MYHSLNSVFSLECFYVQTVHILSVSTAFKIPLLLEQPGQPTNRFILLSTTLHIVFSFTVSLSESGGFLFRIENYQHTAMILTIQVPSLSFAIWWFRFWKLLWIWCILSISSTAFHGGWNKHQPNCKVIIRIFPSGTKHLCGLT